MSKARLTLSPVSRRFVCDGEVFRIEIYKAVDAERWSLQVVSADHTVIKWDETYNDEWTAYRAAITAIEEDGAQAFKDGEYIIFLADQDQDA